MLNLPHLIYSPYLPFTTHTPRALILAVGLALTCACIEPSNLSAQDSVSRNANGGNGLPGDALAPWTSTFQRQSFVVDLTQTNSSWGTPFGIAPLIKQSKISTARFSVLNGPATISADLIQNAASSASAFRFWSQAGAGLNTTENNTTTQVTNITPPAALTRQSVAVLEYEEVALGANFPFFNQIVTAQIGYDPLVPTRLYVTRVVAAANSINSGTLDRSQLGLGSIDASNNLTFRADGFNVTSSTDILAGNNIFRTAVASRTTSVNLISGVGASNASVRLINAEPITLATPNSVPASLLGGLPMSLTPSLAGDLRIETTANSSIASTAHLITAFDHRGSPSVSTVALFPSTISTFAMVAQPSQASNKVNALVVNGVNASRQVVPGRLLSLPASIQSVCNNTTWSTNDGEFRHYDSQATFRGGSGQVAIGRDQAGNAMIAAVISRGAAGFADNPANAIAVASFNPAVPNSAVTWSLAAWVDPTTNTGSAIRGDFGLDGAAFTGDAGEGDGLINASDGPIGRLATLTDAAPFFVGPSLSAPAMDAYGNVYFIAATFIKTLVGQTVIDVPAVSLLRAVRTGTGCYDLELILREGQIILGRNSARSYRIDALNLGDSDSISSASLWASSASCSTWNGMDTSIFPPADSRHLGGLVLCARVTYDVDNDGDFADPSLTTGAVDTVSADEGYHVVLYVGNTQLDPGSNSSCPACPADYNQDGGVTGDDIAAFFSDFESGVGCADTNVDGGITGDDIAAFFIAFENGGC